MMKKQNVKFWLAAIVLVSLVGCSGQKLNFSKVLQKEEPATFEVVDLQTLQSSMSQAVLAINTTNSKSLPFVTMDTNARIDIEETPDTIDFITESLLTSNYKTYSDGAESFDFLSESADIFGRKDRRIGAITYRAQKPDKTQVKKIKKWLLKQNKSQIAKKSTGYRDVVISFQAEANLSQDGQFGPKSATALAQNMAMINVEALDNHIFYPKKPNHMIFILPYDTFKNNEAKLSQGFQSLLEVGKLGISKDEFKSTVTQGEKYILFAYFFDRVNPTFSINLGFSTAAKQWDVDSSSRQKYYPTPGGWPVIVEEFTVAESLSEALFINVFFQESRFKFRCAGSHQLL